MADNTGRKIWLAYNPVDRDCTPFRAEIDAARHAIDRGWKIAQVDFLTNIWEQIPGMETGSWQHGTGPGEPKPAPGLHVAPDHG